MFYYSCSSDKSIRIWTVNGKYLGTLGTFKPWRHISYNEAPNDADEYLMPADIKRCASSTTFKVNKQLLLIKTKITTNI